MIALETYRKRLNKLLHTYSHLEQQVKEERVALDTAVEAVEHAKHAQEIVQVVAQSVQQQAHEQIAKIVSRCLEAVFDEPYQFRIVFERKRGRTEARLVFLRDGLEHDPMTASGGGVVDVAAFALRLACLVLARPVCRRLEVLDEPFRFVSREYGLRIRDLLLSLSKDLKVQIIMVTHSKALQIGNVIPIGD